MNLGIHGGHYGLKFLKFCIVIYISLFLTACGKGTSNMNISHDSGAAKDSADAAVKEQEWAFVPELIAVGDKKADYGNMQLIGGSICYISMNGEAENEEQNICRYSLTDKELSCIAIDWPMEEKNREIGSYSFKKDYSVCLVVNVYSEDFSQLKRFLCQFDPEGKSVCSQEITEQLGKDVSISGVAADGKGQIYIFTNEAGICLYGSDGNYHGSIPYDSSFKSVWIKGILNGEDEGLYVCISKGESLDHCALMEVDFEKKQLIELVKDFPKINGLCVDLTKQYDLLLYDDTFVYGFDCSTGKKEELFTWMDSNVNGYFVKNFGLLEEGRYYAIVEDWENDDRSIVLLTRTRMEEVPKQEKIVLAAVNGGSGLNALAIGFNRDNIRYHLTVKNFDSLTDLYNALLAKETIDIIDLSGVDVRKLSKQGIFTDLFPYLEQSETLGRSDFLDGILDVYTFDGILAGIPETFTLRTVVGDRTQIGNDAGLSLDGMLAAIEQNPGAVPFDGITKEEMMQYLMMFNEDTFIDWSTGECYFDSELFKDILEVVNRLPDEHRNAQDVTLPDKIQNREVLFAIADMNMLKSYQPYAEMFGENAACVGFPTADGKGGTLLFPENAFGITAGSESKSGSWKFIEYVLGQEDVEGMEKEEVYRLYARPYRFPVLKNILDIMIEYRMEEDSRCSEDQFSVITYDDGWQFRYHAVTWEEINTIFDLLKEAVPSFYVEEDEIIKIINEEAADYYHGQKGIDEVVSIIQKRIRLYVGEQI